MLLKSRSSHHFSRIELYRLPAILIFFLLISSTTLHAQSRIYVDANRGNDSNSGTIDQPFATFAKAEAALYAGDTLVVRGGTYPEWVRFNTRSGTTSAPIVVMAYPGELPVIDGQRRLPGQKGYGLIHVDKDYFHISGLEVKNSSAGGIFLGGVGNRVSNMHVHDIFETGIGGYGDYSIIEDCYVHDVNLMNINGTIALTTGCCWGVGITAARGGYGVDDTTDHAIIRRNIVHDSWGEGISTYEAKYTLMEDNIVYDVFSATFYISDAQYVTARRNLIYATKIMAGKTGRSVGLYVGDEVYHPVSMGDTIVNNTVFGTGRCLYVNAAPYSLIANNTFVNSTYAATVQFGVRAGKTSFVNNIVIQDDALRVILFTDPTTTQVACSHNLWSKTPDAHAAGSGDIVGDAKIARTGSTAAGELSRDYFSLLPTSPAIDAGTEVGLPSVGSAPDLGALEVGASSGTLLLPPTPDGPVNGATGVSSNPTLTWTPSAGASAYWLQLSLTSDFSAVLYDQSALTQTSQTIASLTASTRYYWRVSAANADATSQWSPTWSFTTSSLTGLNNPRPSIPTTYSLDQNYPNPFNPSTTITFGLPEESSVTLEVYDSLGSKVRTLLSNQMMSAAFHSVVWNGRNDKGSFVSSGMYFYRISTNLFRATRKMLLMQ